MSQVSCCPLFQRFPCRVLRRVGPHTVCPPPTNMLGSPLPILCGSVPIVLAAHPFSLASLPAARSWRKLHLERHLRPLAGGFIIRNTGRCRIARRVSLTLLRQR